MRASPVRGAVVLLLSSVVLAACTTSRSSDSPTSVTADLILSDLRNPRGVAVDAEGGLLVAEAGLGDDVADVTQRALRLTRFIDRNGDGGFRDPGGTKRCFEHLASHDAVNTYATGRDEVSGPSDITVHGDGRVFLSVDGGFDDFALWEISPDGSIGRDLLAVPT